MNIEQSFSSIHTTHFSYKSRRNNISCNLLNKLVLEFISSSTLWMEQGNVHFGGEK